MTQGENMENDKEKERWFLEKAALKAQDKFHAASHRNQAFAVHEAMACAGVVDQHINRQFRICETCNQKYDARNKWVNDHILMVVQFLSDKHGCI